MLHVLGNSSDRGKQVIGHDTHSNLDLCWRGFRHIRKLILSHLVFSTHSSFGTLVSSFLHLEDLELIAVRVMDSFTPRTLGTNSRRHRQTQLRSLRLQIDGQEAAAIVPWLISRRIAHNITHLHRRPVKNPELLTSLLLVNMSRLLTVAGKSLYELLIEDPEGRGYDLQHNIRLHTLIISTRDLNAVIEVLSTVSSQTLTELTLSLDWSEGTKGSHPNVSELNALLTSDDHPFQSLQKVNITISRGEWFQPSAPNIPAQDAVKQQLPQLHTRIGSGLQVTVLDHEDAPYY